MFSFIFTALAIGISSGVIGITMDNYGVTSHIAYYFLGVGTVILANIIALILEKKNSNRIET